MNTPPATDDTPPAPTDTVAAIVAAVRATRPVRTRTSPHYGRRAQDGMTQLGVVIPTALKERLVSFARDSELQLTEAAQVLLEIALATVERRPA